MLDSSAIVKKRDHARLAVNILKIVPSFCPVLLSPYVSDFPRPEVVLNPKARLRLSRCGAQ